MRYSGLAAGLRRRAAAGELACGASQFDTVEQLAHVAQAFLRVQSPRQTATAVVDFDDDGDEDVQQVGAFLIQKHRSHVLASEKTVLVTDQPRAPKQSFCDPRERKF